MHTFLGVLRAMWLAIAFLTLGLLFIPVSIFLALVEEWWDENEHERAERRRSKKERSKGRGLYVRY